MDPHLYKNIKECDGRACWPYVRDAVASQLMGPGVIPVPYLIDAPFYDVASVIVKESLSPVEKMTRKKAGIITVGTIQDFIVDDRDTELSKHFMRTRKPMSSLNPEFVFEEEDLKNKIKKSVTVKIDGCYRCTLENIPSEEDSLAVNIANKGFNYLTKLFLVYEVYYAKRVVVTVSIGNDVDRVEIEEEIPIGFKMRRYKIKEDGTLGICRDEENRSKYEWIKRSHFRNPMDALPDPCTLSDTGKW